MFSPIADYEDAIMVETAKNAGIDYIVTRNIKDYSKSPVKVTSPAEFLEELLSYSQYKYNKQSPKAWARKLHNFFQKENRSSKNRIAVASF